jgi:hypothetical protein
MPRTNVVGTTAAAGSGARRCAQAGERKHRTDSTTGTAERAAAGLKADQLVKQLGLRWPDIIAVKRAPTTVAADGGDPIPRWKR